MNRINVFISVTAATVIAFLVSIYMIFFYAPTLGSEFGKVVQKLFYVHVPSAWVGMLAFFVVFVTSIAYLNTNNEAWYIKARSAAEIGLIFLTITLITGPIWGRMAWNAWWNWYDTKLVSALLLWLLYIGYIIIGSSVEEPDKRARFQSVYGIMAFIDVPVVFLSVRLWQKMSPESAGTHPVLTSMSPSILITLIISLTAFTLLFVQLMMIRTELERADLEVKSLLEDRRANES